MTSDEEFAACDHSDRLFDLVLGNTMAPSGARLGFFAGLAIAVAAVFTIVSGLS